MMKDVFKFLNITIYYKSMESMAIIYSQNQWQLSYKNSWKVMIIYLKTMTFIYFIPYYKTLESIYLYIYIYNNR